MLDKRGGQRIKVGRRVIQMLFPMIQMANNDRQSAYLIFDNAFYLYQTKLFSLYSEHKCTDKNHWHILYAICLMITELSRLKKKGSNRGRDSDPSNEQSGKLHTKAAEKILLPGFEQVFDKNSTQWTLQLPGLCVDKCQMPCYSPDCGYI